MSAKIAGKPGQKYLITPTVGRYGYADTLADAKRVGHKIAKLEAYKGHWNSMYIAIAIYASSSGTASYKQIGWKMYVPVAGSGKRLAYIIEQIKLRHGVAPFKWTKK